MKRSIRSQLSFMTAMVVLVTVILISLLSNLFINWKFKDYITRQQRQNTQELAASLGFTYQAASGSWDTDFIHTIGMYALYDGYIIKVYDNQGNSVWDAEQHDMSRCAQVMADISERMQEKYPRLDGEFVSQDFPLYQEGARIGTASLSYYGPYFLNENDFGFLSALNTILFGVGLLSLILALLVGWVMSKKISRPVIRTAQAAQAISAGDYQIRFDTAAGIKELDGLVASVNQLADSLHRQEALRKRLTADVAHELRTPLTTVGTHLEAMMEGVWEPTAGRLLSCHEEIIRITALVQDLESLAKVESENLKLNLKPVNLHQLVKSVEQTLETEIYRKKLELTIQGNVSCVYGDPDRLRQVVLNLLSNSAKYTPEGGKIRVILEETNCDVIMTVEDNGIGIPEEEQPFIFERFYRADKSRNRKTGGAGIGLAIVKSIVDAHKGSVNVKSVLGSGSQFTVKLPKA